MLKVFIDTNIYLNFFSFSNEDIEQIRKFIALVKAGKCDIILTRQVEDEFIRNRDGKVKEALDRFKSNKLSADIPVYFKIYPEYEELISSLKAARKIHSELFQVAKKDAENFSTEADKVMDGLFDLCKIGKIKDAIFEKAYVRHKLGNPPGKNKVTIGDQVNWEYLLSLDWTEDELHFISGDSDFVSELGTGAFNEFLRLEFCDVTKKEINYYDSMNSFFEQNFPEIKIASDVKVNDLIEKLAVSPSFARTHLLIAELRKQENFSTSQVNTLVDIAQQNEQVRWIVDDFDVELFYNYIYEKHGDKLTNERREWIKENIEILIAF